ncbi:MAG TPA: choice-of-anchor Q domain-containing protein [Micromonosporaceae bacterium]
MAVQFDATSSEFTGTAGVATAPLTILVWGYISSDLDDFQTFVAFDDGSDTNAILLQTNSDGTTFRPWVSASGSADAFIPTNGGMSVSKWYRLAFVLNADGTSKIYIGPEDGPLVSEDMEWSNGVPTGLTTIRIGNSVLNTEDLDGRVANVKVYSAALSAAEVEAEFGSWNAVRTDDLVQHYKFKTVSTTDDSGNGHTLSGGTGVTQASDPPIPTELVDATNVEFTDSGGLSSTFHIFGEGLPTGAGLVVHLHGDGAYGYLNPTHPYALGGNRGLVEVANAKGYALVSVLAPDTTGSVTWWENGDRKSDYLAELIDHLIDTYDLGREHVWLVGYSGGAQQITQFFVPKHGKAKITGGGALIISGGGVPITTPTGWDATFKAAFPMYWVTGALDDGTHSDDGYDALDDAQTGSSYYSGQGFTADLNVPAAIGHELDGVFGAMLDDVLPAMPGIDVPDRTPGSTRPTLIASYINTAGSTNSTVSPAFTPDPGEVIVVKTWNQDLDNPNIDSMQGGGLSFGTRRHVQASDHAEVWVWVAEVGDTSPGEMTVTTTWWGTGGNHGMVVERWANTMVTATPAGNDTVTGTGTPNVTVTPTNANSVLTWVNADWNVTSGTPSYRNGATQTQVANQNNIRAFAAYQEPDDISAQTVGMTAPTGQTWSIAAVELLPAPDPEPKTIYVATTGDDDNDGLTTGTAKATIAGGMSVAGPGDTVLVADGTYEGNVLTPKGGSSGAYITVKAENKWGATIKGDNSDEKEAAVELNHEYVRIEGFEITGDLDSGLRNGVSVNASNVQVVGCHIHTICQFLTEGTSWEGGAGVDFWYEGDLENVLIDANLIHNIGLWEISDQQLVHGLYPAQPASNCVISNNVIYECEDYGIQPYPQDEATGWIIVNNTVAVTGRGIRTGDDTIVRNNISFNNKTADFDVRGSGSTLSNNISFGDGSGTQTGVTVVDPQVVDFSGRDFQLAAGSPAIDAGTSTNAPQTDFLGVTRPQGSGVDIGAYEAQLAVTGTGAADLGGLTGSASGTRTTPGTAAAPLGELSGQATGLRATSGTAESLLGSLAAVATGTREVIGSGSTALGALVATAAGTRIVSASAGAPLGGLSSTATGEVIPEVVTGTGAAPLGALDGQGSGTRTTFGAASGDLGALSAAASGVVIPEVVIGTGASELGGLSASASGTRIVPGTAIAPLGGLDAEGIGEGVAQIIDGTATAALGGLDATATGTRTTAGTGAADLGGLTGSASGTRHVDGTATAGLGDMSATATGTRATVGTGIVVLGALVATADGATIVTGTAAAQLGGLGAHADGRVIELVVGTGSAPLGGLTATAFQDMTGIRPYAGEPIVSGLRAGTPVVTAPVAGQPEPA